MEELTPTLPATGSSRIANPPKPPKAFCAEGASHPGRRRAANEDAFWIDEDLGLIAVADGVSSARGGGVAAELCVRSVGSFFARHGSALRATGGPRDLVALLRQSLTAARTELAAQAELRAMPGMATTLTVLLCHGADVVIANLGDSRVYRLRGEQMEQLTDDHTLLAESLRRGVHPDPAIAPRMGATITRYMARGNGMEAQFYPMQWKDGDVYLLCSDGLSSYVPEMAIRSVIVGASNLEDAAASLIDAANVRGGSDNVTAVLLRLRAVP